MMIMVLGILLHMSLQVSAVETYEGQSILLFCEFEIFELDRPIVKWSRSDLSPPIVHQLQEAGDELMDQNQLYTGRTSMKADALETGDLSLKLTNLQTSDTGTYSCTVRNVMGERRVRDEELLVKELFPSWAKALLVLFVLVLTVAAGIILYYFRHRLRPELKVEMEKKMMVEVLSGEECVLLPCKMVGHLPKDVKVKWVDAGNRVVHVYQNGSDQPQEQDQLYRNKTKVKRDLQKTGDFSLTLRHPTYEDNNVYTCSVHSWLRNIQIMKQVQLEVKVQQVEVDSGAESVLLPWRTKVHLEGNGKVEWRDKENDVVHVYQNGSDQPGEQDLYYRNRTKMNEDPLNTGDLSLTLKYPEVSDGYTCRVYSSDGEILLEKHIQLEVKDHEVEVEDGVESVLLPFKETLELLAGDRVEWKRYEPEPPIKVHVYQIGSDHPGKWSRLYRNRTKMDVDLLKTGDLSLTLRCPTKRDNGDYQCVLLREEELLRVKYFSLKVKVQQVKVESGIESVLLPCRTKVHLPEDATVEWKDRQDSIVHVYENGVDQPTEQNLAYRSRTKMNEDPVKTGDLSLTLRCPEFSDDYTCRVYSSDGEILMEKQVQLHVKDHEVEVEVEDGVESVLLPFKETLELLAGDRVEWKRYEPEPVRSVHVYQNGSVQTRDQDQFYRTRTKMDADLLKIGDLSLILTWPTKRDSGKYECKVLREQKVLRKKWFHLKVKAGTVQIQVQPEDIRTRSSVESTPLMVNQSV
ncbi:uncharacterized protein LOC102225860 [Xiphophorus maculatus]|uniref:uncharacterized protein LOC102225860 n=1 Tax=Xiphophorus maculatus TaxID=8083 RepID=UPI000C6D5C4A|nr:uncharacterized protein LOC102225860 [Xiphophorus maculatus]